MKLSHIANILRLAGLPLLSKEQLLAIAGTDAGKPFQKALLALENGDASQMPYLSRLIQCVNASTVSSLARLGLSSSLDDVLQASARDHDGMMNVLSIVDSPAFSRAAAVSFLSGLGLGSAALASDDGSAPAASAHYYSFKIYGTSAALCISEAKTRKDGAHTIQVEGAAAAPGGGIGQPFAWADKIIVQLSTQEMFLLLAVLENEIDEIHFSGHGQRHDKFMQVQLQGKHFYFKLGRKGQPVVGVQVGGAESIKIVSLAYRQILLNEPHLDNAMVRTMILRVARMHNAGVAARQ